MTRALFDNRIGRRKEKAGQGQTLPALNEKRFFGISRRMGQLPLKEVAPMWQFLTDVAAQVVAGVVVALIVRRLMK